MAENRKPPPPIGIQVAASHPLAQIACPVCPEGEPPYSPIRCAAHAAVGAPSRRGGFGDMRRLNPRQPRLLACPNCGKALDLHQACWGCGRRWCWDCGLETGSILRAFCGNAPCRPVLGAIVTAPGEDAELLEEDLRQAGGGRRW